MHSKFLLCFNVLVESYIFKTLSVGCSTNSLKFSEYIPYFCEFRFGIEREIPLLSQYGVFFSLYAFHMKLGLSSFLICIFQRLGTANAFNESSVYYSKLRGHHM